MRLAEKNQVDAAGKMLRSSFFLRGITLIVLFIGLVGASLAWTALNDQANSGNIGVSVDYDRFFVEQGYYKYNVNEGRVDYYSSLVGIDFNQYDLVFRSRNRYTPIVAAIRMTGDDLADSGTVTIQIKRDSSISAMFEENSTNHLSHYFTNIMRVTALVGSSFYSSDNDTLFNNVDTNTNYEAARAQTGNTTNSKVFTTAELSNDQLVSVTKSDIEFNISYTSSDFVTINGKSTLIVYLYITYDEGYDGVDYNGLIGTFIKTSDSMSIISTGDISDTSIKFENDLMSIKVYHS